MTRQGARYVILFGAARFQLEVVPFGGVLAGRSPPTNGIGSIRALRPSHEPLTPEQSPEPSFLWPRGGLEGCKENVLAQEHRFGGAISCDLGEQMLKLSRDVEAVPVPAARSRGDEGLVEGRTNGCATADSLV